MFRPIYWIIVADVPDAEAHFHAHEFLDATVQPKPIYISPNEIYTMHGLLSQYLNQIVTAFILASHVFKIFFRLPIKTISYELYSAN